jgi:hypothetical protein
LEAVNAGRDVYHRIGDGLPPRRAPNLVAACVQ